jgi:hypothetical protein
MFCNLEHPCSISPPKLVKAEGKVMDVRDEQFSNAHLSIVVTASGIMIEGKVLHP